MALEPNRVVFVGGAPRSGTTVTHALLCTAPEVNNYHAEASFVRAVFAVDRLARANWDYHSHDFFDGPDAIGPMMRDLVDVMLNHLWLKLDHPNILCIKDPHLTMHFRELADIYGDEARFVTVARHPHNVVRSRQEVHDKCPNGRPFSAADVEAVATEYVQIYTSVLTKNFSSRHLLVRYEHLSSPLAMKQLADFTGVSGFDKSKMWEGGTVFNQTSVWHSPKYQDQIDMAPRLAPLSDEFIDITNRICGPIMDHFGYQ